jgi:hypothetical protein
LYFSHIQILSNAGWKKEKIFRGFAWEMPDIGRMFYSSSLPGILSSLIGVLFRFLLGVIEGKGKGRMINGSITRI